MKRKVMKAVSVFFGFACAASGIGVLACAYFLRTGEVITNFLLPHWTWLLILIISTIFFWALCVITKPGQENIRTGTRW